MAPSLSPWRVPETRSVDSASFLGARFLPWRQILQWKGHQLCWNELEPNPVTPLCLLVSAFMCHPGALSGHLLQRQISTISQNNRERRLIIEGEAWSHVDPRGDLIWTAVNHTEQTKTPERLWDFLKGTQHVLQGKIQSSSKAPLTVA